MGIDPMRDSCNLSWSQAYDAQCATHPYMQTLVVLWQNTARNALRLQPHSVCILAYRAKGHGLEQGLSAVEVQILEEVQNNKFEQLHANAAQQPEH